MRLTQTNLVQSFPAFVTALKAAQSGMPNLHLAIVSSDMGAGDGSVASCDSTNGKNGIFQYTARGTCASSGLNAGATYISDIAGVRNNSLVGYGIVVGLAEEPLAPPIAGEEQGGIGLRRRQQVPQVLVRRSGVADLELHRAADLDGVTDGDGPAALVGADHAPDQEVAAAELEAGLVDDAADLEPMAHELPLLVGGGGGRLLEPLQGRLAAQFEDEVPVRPGHHVRLADRPAALGDDGADLDAACQHGAHGAGVDDLVVDHQPVPAGLHGRRGQAADHLELGQVLVHPTQEGVGREGEGVGEQQHGAVGVIGPADQRRAVGSRHDFEAGGGQQRLRQPGGEEGEGGGVLHLAPSADHRPGQGEGGQGRERRRSTP